MRPSGETVAYTRNNELQETFFIDAVFSETAATTRQIPNVAEDSTCWSNGLIFVACKSPKSRLKVTCENLDTGDLSASPPLPPNATITFICGSYISTEDRDATDDTHVEIISINNPSSRIHLYPCPAYPVHYAFNETLLAHIKDDPAHVPRPKLNLVRLKDKQQIASCWLSNEESIEILDITRFHVFVAERNVCWVFDLKLNLLCTLPRYVTVWDNGVQGEYELSKPATDWMVYYTLSSSYHFTPGKLMMTLDPKIR
ncbi:hypothetical protein HDV00_000400, partial [Rhizophlyctis rosea]